MAKLAIASTSLQFLVINREIFIPKREIGRFSLFDKKSGDLPPNRETWKLCILQEDLDERTAWSTKWLLTFHPDKCKIMNLGKSLEEQFKYTLHDGRPTIIHELGYMSEEKDLGVIID